MAQFTTYLLFIVFAVIFGISQCSEDCFYHPGQRGKKCFDGHQKYTCCPTDQSCDHGKCSSLNSNSPSKHVPIHNYIIIGVAVSVFAIVCMIIGALYWHRKQMKQIEKPLNPLASFSQSTNGAPHATNSVGFRIRPSKAQPAMSVSSVNIKIPPTMTN